MVVRSRQQPQSPARVDKSNPMFARPLAVVSCAHDVNAATGRMLTGAGSGFAKAYTGAGKVLRFRKNYYRQTEVLPAIGTQSFVEFWYGYPIAFGAAGNATEAAFVTGSNTNLNGIAINLRNGNPNWGAIVSWPSVIDSGEILTLGKLTCLVCVRTQSDVQLWRDGVLIKSASTTPVSFPAESLVLGGFIEDSGYWTSSNDTLLAGRVMGAWTPAQVKAFSENPWQAFAPQRRPSASIEPGGTNGTATPQGIQAVGQAGNVTAKAGARAQSYGVQASGQVGNVTAKGGAKTSVAGVQASGQVGQAVARVSSTARPAGVQAIGLVGQVVARGTAAAQATGVQAVGRVGNATAKAGGSVTARPTGVQAVGQVGQVTARAGARVAVGSVQATGRVGDASARGSASITVAGVQAVGRVGNVSAKGRGVAAVVGVRAVGYVGNAKAFGYVGPDAVARVVGVQASGQVGQVIARGTHSSIVNKLTLDDICQAVRDYIMTVTPPGMRVIRTPVNRADMPADPYVSFTPGAIRIHSTNRDSYTDNSRAVRRAESMAFQVDCYGEGSYDLAHVLNILFRDQYGIENLTDSVVPLYAGDIMQAPYVTGEDQYEQRYLFEIEVQLLGDVVVSQQSCNILGIDLISVDEAFPP